MRQDVYPLPQINLQAYFDLPGSCQMEGIISLYNYIMTYLVIILGVVTLALIYTILVHMHGNRHSAYLKFEKSIIEAILWLQYLKNWTHSTILEIVWTIVPSSSLMAIAGPSFVLLYSLDEVMDTQCAVKIIAFQWYWQFEYPVMDSSGQNVWTFSYLSYMVPVSDLTEDKDQRLLEVDAPLVLPINVNCKLIITSKDVIHSFAVPSLGIKMDAVPGRLNQVTVHILKPGMYYGQCSELCGVNHAYMPIAIAAVDFSVFERFLRDGAEKEAGEILFGFSGYEETLAELTVMVVAFYYGYEDGDLLDFFRNPELEEMFHVFVKRFNISYDQIFNSIFDEEGNPNIEAIHQIAELNSLVGFLKEVVQKAVDAEKLAKENNEIIQWALSYAKFISENPEESLETREEHKLMYDKLCVVAETFKKK